MTVALQKPQPASGATRDKAASASPLEQYRAFVWEVVEGKRAHAVPPASIMDPLLKFPTDFEQDVATARERLEAARVIREDVPELQAKVNELKAQVAKEPDPPHLKPHCAKLPDVIEISTTRLKLHEVRSELNREWSRANGVLWGTSDPALDPQERRLSDEIAALRRGIDGRSEEGRLNRVQFLRDGLERLAQGKYPEGLQRSPSESIAKMRVRWEAELREAEGLLANQTPEQIAEMDARDEERLRTLEQELVDVRRSRFEPRNMRWHHEQADTVASLGFMPSG